MPICHGKSQIFFDCKFYPFRKKGVGVDDLLNYAIVV